MPVCGLIMLCKKGAVPMLSEPRLLFFQSIY
jgi:hypothetical protein